MMYISLYMYILGIKFNTCIYAYIKSSLTVLFPVEFIFYNHSELQICLCNIEIPKRIYSNIN